MEKWHRDCWWRHTNRFIYILEKCIQSSLDYLLLYSAINWKSCKLLWKNGIEIYGEDIPTDIDILWGKYIQSSLYSIHCFTQQLTENLQHIVEKWHRDFWWWHTNSFGYIVEKMSTEFFRLYALLYSAINWKSCKLLWKNGIEIYGEGIPNLDSIHCFTRQLTEKVVTYCGKMA